MQSSVCLIDVELIAKDAFSGVPPSNMVDQVQDSVHRVTVLCFLQLGHIDSLVD